YLTAYASASAATASVGQWVKLMLTVTAGGGTVSNILPSDLQTAGAGTFIGGANPPGPLTLGAGAAATFTWTYSVAGAGAHAFSLSGTGLSSLCAAVTAFASDTTSFSAVAPALLSGTLLLTPA